MKVILVGNCQVEHIANFMQQAVVDESVEITAAKPVYLIEPEEVSKLHNQISQCDLLICQPIGDEYRSNIGLGTKFLISLLPETSKALVIPNLYYDASFPTFGYFKDSSGEAIRASDPMWSQNLPWGDYHDYLLFAAVLRGLRGPDYIRLVQQNSGWNVESIKNKSLLQMEKRDASCDIKGMEIFASFNADELASAFHSYNHPTNKLMLELSERILKKISVNYTKLENTSEKLLHPKLPIYSFTTGFNSFSEEVLLNSFAIYKSEYTANIQKILPNVVSKQFLDVCKLLMEEQ